MEFEVIRPGLLDYRSGLSLQKEIQFKVREGLAKSTLVVCSHYPVITLGRSAKRENLLCLPEELERKGIGLCSCERGGDITYHGPGQITAYPIFNLALLRKDIHFFLRQLEEVALRFLADLGIRGERRYGLTGAWVGCKKIASIGISIRNWITFHGLSINIKSEDLGNFRLIRPCGMDVGMTCVEEILEKSLDLSGLSTALEDKFQEVFYREEGIWQK